jgi:protein SCO1/2
VSRQAKILAASAWGLLVVVTLVFIASGALRSGARRQIKPVLGRAPVFSLVDQDGLTFASSSLAGKVWVCDFIFTRCAGPCPLLTGNMVSLQQALRDTSVELVTFSVDPDYDTPEVLRAYARQWGADPTRWTLLTGEMATIQAVAKAMLAAVEPAHGDQPIIHNTNLFIVDAEGNIRGPYAGQEPDSWKAVAADARALAAGR